MMRHLIFSISRLDFSQRGDSGRRPDSEYCAQAAATATKSLLRQTPVLSRTTAAHAKRLRLSLDESFILPFPCARAADRLHSLPV